MSSCIQAPVGGPDEVAVNRVGLLVSVRNRAEAAAAVVGGADVVDIKNPSAGALGAASASDILSILDEVAGRRPVTAAAGELTDLGSGIDFLSQLGPRATELALVKVGSAGAPSKDFAATIEKLQCKTDLGDRLVLAAYADWNQCQAPAPQQVLQASIALGLRWMLVDTWDKQDGGLFEHFTTSEVKALLVDAERNGVRVVLAGKLAGEALQCVIGCSPALVGVRSAACGGDRQATVQTSYVRNIKNAYLGPVCSEPMVL